MALLHGRYCILTYTSFHLLRVDAVLPCEHRHSHCRSHMGQISSIVLGCLLTVICIGDIWYHDRLHQLSFRPAQYRSIYVSSANTQTTTGLDCASSHPTEQSAGSTIQDCCSKSPCRRKSDGDMVCSILGFCYRTHSDFRSHALWQFGDHQCQLPKRAESVDLPLQA